MPSLISGDWRAVLAWASVPAGIVVLLSYFAVYESPRFLLIKGLPEDVCDISL